MMFRSSSTLLLIAQAVAIGSAQEANLTRAQVPSAVKAAISQRFPQAKLSHWAKETEAGITTFEVSVADTKGKRDAVFSSDGSLVSIETAMPVSSLPDPVKKAIRAKYSDAEISKAEKITLASNLVQYEVDLLKAAKNQVLLSAEGKILKEE